MEGSTDRVRDVIHGRTLDRARLYDLLRNDAVANPFSGETRTADKPSEMV